MLRASDFPQFLVRRCPCAVSVRRLLVVLVTLLATVPGRSASALGSPTDFQATEPTPEQISQAAKYFDQGRDAFRRENFIEAAEAFEKADALAPNAKVLLLAVQSRELGGQLARAATLAAMAQQRHPKDPLFNDVGDLLKTAKEGLHLLVVTCAEPCRLTVGDRLVHGGAATRRYLFLEEGSHRIRANWGEGNGLSKFYQAAPGTRGKLRFESEPAEQRDDWADDDDAAAAGEGDEPPSDTENWGDGSDWGDPAPEPAQTPPAHADAEARTATGGWSPTVFWTGVAVTGVLVGVSTWSGIDTLNNPGKDAVVAKCVGLGESCPEYQEGLGNQLRTNVLWGVTGGVGVVTALIGLWATNWDGDEAAAAETSVKLDLVPLLGRAERGSAPRDAHLQLAGSMITASGRF